MASFYIVLPNPILHVLLPPDSIVQLYLSLSQPPLILLSSSSLSFLYPNDTYTYTHAMCDSHRRAKLTIIHHTCWLWFLDNTADHCVKHLQWSFTSGGSVW